MSVVKWGGEIQKLQNWMTVWGILSPGKQAMKRACQGEKKTAQRRKGLPVRVLRIERRSNQQQIRKGRYFAYGRTVVYESWRSGAGIGRVQVLCLQNRAEAQWELKEKGLLKIDHIIPVAKGGQTVEDNLQTLCWKCNRAKSDKMIA